MKGVNTSNLFIEHLSYKSFMAVLECVLFLKQWIQ